MADPAFDIATALAANATVTVAGSDGVVGTNIIPGPVRAPGGKIPEACIFVTETGAYPPEDFFGSSTTPIRPATVQITIRGPGPSASTPYATCRAEARAVWLAIHEATISGYVSVRCLQGEPFPLGLDDTEHERWVVNILAQHGSVTS